MIVVSLPATPFTHSTSLTSKCIRCCCWRLAPRCGCTCVLCISAESHVRRTDLSSRLIGGGVPDAQRSRIQCHFSGHAGNSSPACRTQESALVERYRLSFAAAVLLFSPYLTVLLTSGIELTISHWGDGGANGWQAIVTWLTVLTNGQPLLLLSISSDWLDIWHSAKNCRL